METTTILHNGSAFFTASLPLPKDHWLTAPDVPGWDSKRRTAPDTPHPFLNHTEHRGRVVEAMRWAIRGATMRGQIQDFDPDALVKNAVYAMCGPFGGATNDAV